MVDRVRYGRQIRLPEIGEAGQARLAEAEIVLGGAGAAREIEATYLVRAGARVVHEGDDAALSVDVGALGLRHAAARDVAEGALRALVGIHAALKERA
ncbi:MAG: hypothetical protein KF819_16725 [Labilithrix sp.]|nr:hypothetical protein [Labilithrix sp.]